MFVFALVALQDLKPDAPLRDHTFFFSLSVSSSALFFRLMVFIGCLSGPYCEAVISAPCKTSLASFFPGVSFLCDVKPARLFFAFSVLSSYFFFRGTPSNTQCKYFLLRSPFLSIGCFTNTPHLLIGLENYLLFGFVRDPPSGIFFFSCLLRRERFSFFNPHYRCLGGRCDVLAFSPFFGLITIKVRFT